MRIKHYEQYQLLILERAISFHKKTGIDVNDLIGQANLIYCIARQKYKPERKAKFSVFLYHCLNNRLFDYVKKQRRYDNIIKNYKSHKESKLQLNSQTNISLYLNNFNLFYFIEKLSKEAQFIVNIFLSDPIKILKIKGTESPREIRSKLCKYLRQKNWKYKKIWDTYTELKSFIHYLG